MEPSSRDPAQHEQEPFSPMRRVRSERNRPRRMPDLGTWLGYTVSAVMVSVGGAVMAGYFVHGGVPERFRWTFGIVLILMGIYRFFLTRIRVQQKAMEQEDDE